MRSGESAGLYSLPGAGARFKKVLQSLRLKIHILISKFKEQRSGSGTLAGPICFFNRQSYCKLVSELLKLPT